MVSVEPGQKAEVVKQEAPNNNGGNNNGSNNGSNTGNDQNNAGSNNQNQNNGNKKPSTSKNASKANGKLADSGADVSVFAGITVLFLAAGAALATARKMLRH